MQNPNVGDRMARSAKTAIDDAIDHAKGQQIGGAAPRSVQPDAHPAAPPAAATDPIPSAQ